MNDRLHALAQVAGLAVLATSGLLLVADRGGRLGPAGDRIHRTPTGGGAGGAVATTAIMLPTHGGVTASSAVAAATRPPASPAAPSPAVEPTPAAGRVAPSTPTVQRTRVGIIPGHWEYDSGAVCPDGLREVDVTTDVALRVRALLEVRGFEVDLLPEHDPAVPQAPTLGYDAAALVSIHADSCDVPGVSGFKAARGRYSTTPEQDDRLVDCLTREYGQATLLPRHDDTITPNMWNYYVFREIGSRTPAAIIELGFLNGDRAALDRLRYEMALGIANGVSCFLR